MLTKVSILFLGMTIGGLTFLVTGFASLLIIKQLQDRTLEARAPAPQVSIVAKNAPPVTDARTQMTYLYPGGE